MSQTYFVQNAAGWQCCRSLTRSPVGSAHACLATLVQVGYKEVHVFFDVVVAAPCTSLLVNIGKASNCYTERREIQKKTSKWEVEIKVC